MPFEIDEHTIELIAARVTESLRATLEAVVAELASTNGPQRPLTVEEVADRFGVARSTVYAHWREWGGYKLGEGDRAPIRFEESSLRVAGPPGPAKPRARGGLLHDNPSGAQLLGRHP